MELRDVVRRRRMVRSFTDEPVAPEVLDGVLDLARRAPAAGNADGRAYLVLEGSGTARYWDVALPAGPARDRFGWPGLVAAPVLVVVLASPERYVERYAED